MTPPTEGKHTGFDEASPCWSIMTKSRGGTVSVIRDLTLEQARKTYERLDPSYGQHSTQFDVHKDFLADGTLWSSSGGSWRTCSDGDIEIREVFGPPGWKGFEPGSLESWPKFTRVYMDDKGNILPDEYQTSPETAAYYRKQKATSPTEDKTILGRVKSAITKAHP